MSVQATASTSDNTSIRSFSSGKGQIQRYFLLLSILITIFAATDSHAQSNINERLASDNPRSTFTRHTLRSSSLKASPTVSALGFSLSAALPNGNVGNPYAGSISAVGGTSPYTFSVSTGALPAGLVLDTATGTITGIPSVVVSKTFWVKASDAQGASTRLHTQITVSASSTQSAVTAVSVAVSPASTSISSGAARQFAATVRGTSNTAVHWTTTAGSISSNGFFNAPLVTSSTNVSVTATSAADPTQSTSALVTVIPSATPISVSVSPSSASVTLGATQQFTASVQGTSNAAVTWASSAGAISSSGLFTAPSVTSNATVNILATSVADPSATSTVSIIVTAASNPTPVSPSSGKLCGTDPNGVPTDNSQCGVKGTNSYAGENATDLATWCGGSMPGNCVAITTCNQSLTDGTFSEHSKYYLARNLSCGAASLALQLTRYADINMNGFTITGVVFSNIGVKGWHLFNGTLNCTVQHPSLIASGMYSYGCLQDSNNGGTYTMGGGDQIRIHHISGQNSYGCSKFMQLDGDIPAPASGWTEPAVVVYNNTFQSVPVTTSCTREYAGVYSQTQPVEYYNNQGDVGATGPANATQLLVVYSPASNGSYPNYIHNNYLSCETFNVNNSESTGDTCRPVLCDGALSCHVQYNDLWPTNNRGVRLRDAFNAEVDHNYFHSLLNANGYRGVAVHTGDNDIHSAFGQNLNQKVHDNTIELAAGGLGVFVRDQQGITLAANSYTCAQSGCTSARVADVENLPAVGGFTINQVTKVLSCSTCDFYNGGRAYKTGSSITLAGWANPGNNGTFVVAIGPSSTSATQMVLSDPNNQLVSESGTAAAGTYPATELTLQSASFDTNLAPEALVMRQTIMQECSTLGISVSGGGTALTTCN